MLPENLKTLDHFPAVTLEAWRRVVDADLKGASFDERLITHTDEGIDLLPLYAPHTAASWRTDVPWVSLLPSVQPCANDENAAHARKRAPVRWDLCMWHYQHDLASARRAILEDVEGGATSLWLQWSTAEPSRERRTDASDRFSPADAGLPIRDLDDLATLLSDLPLDRIELVLDAGSDFLPAASMLMAYFQMHGLSPDQCRGTFGADPIGTLARRGSLPNSLPRSLQQLGSFASQIAATWPKMSAIVVDAVTYHEAGATDDFELAASMATAVCYLRTMTSSGMSIDTAARQITFRLAAGSHYFRDIAKFRAMRKLWHRIVTASGGSRDAAIMRLHVRPSLRGMTNHDPHGNLLRNATAVFAACMGNAQSITPLPYSLLVSAADDLHARRLARNTVLIYQHESGLNRVIDPLHGSWFLETFTDQLSELAWQRFQEIEKQGGIASVLENGWLLQQVDRAHLARSLEYAAHKRVIVGVSEYVPDAKGQSSSDDRVAKEPASGLGAFSAPNAVRFNRKPSTAIEVNQIGGDRLDRLCEAFARGATRGDVARILHGDDQPAAVSRFPLRRLAEPFEAQQHSGQESNASSRRHGSEESHGSDASGPREGNA